jgi:hypothetical protein
MLALDPEDVLSAIVFTGDGGDAVGKWCCCEQVLSEDKQPCGKGWKQVSPEGVQPYDEGLAGIVREQQTCSSADGR